MKIVIIIICLIMVGAVSGLVVYLITSRKEAIPFETESTLKDEKSVNRPKNLKDRKWVDDILKEKCKNMGTAKSPIYIYDNFLDDDECDSIIKSGKGKLNDSPLTRPDDDKEFRTSKTAYFENGNNLHYNFEKKMDTFISLPNDSAESTQIQVYDIGNQFKEHYDYFHPGVDDEFLVDGQRTWTFMVYLNDVEEGGETKFTRLNKTIKPKKGTAVIWCNLDDNGVPDEDMLHTGTPVRKGQKHITTRWYRDNTFNKNSIKAKY